jgi:MFS family permease
VSAPLPARPGRRRLASIWLANFTLFLSFYLLTAVFPLYARERGASAAMIGVIVGSLSLFSVLAKPWAGWGADRFGRRPVMAVGALIFLAASVSYAWCAGAVALLAARCMHGIGMGLYPTANAAAMVDVAPPARRGQTIGLLGAGAQLAMAAGPIAGVSLVGQVGFNALFGVSAAIAAVALALVVAIGETLTERSRRPFRLATSLSRAALFPSAISLCLLATFGVQLAFMPIFAQARGVNPGAFFVAFALVVAFVRGPGGGASDRLGRSLVVTIALLVASLGLATLAMAAHLPGLVSAGVLFGLGFGTAHPALMAWSVDGVADADRGRAVGTYLAAFDLGFALGAGASGFAVASLGFRRTFLAAAVVPLVAAGAVLLHEWRARPRAASAES